MNTEQGHQVAGGTAVVEALLQQGVDTVFGIPGVQLDPLFAALHDARNRIRVVHTRHEQGAGYMALGYAMATGRPATAIVVPGPGVLNASSALATAYAQNAPVFCLAGQVPSHHIGRGTGQLHEIPDQLGILRSLTRWAGRIESPGQASSVVAEAFGHLSAGRKGPVAVEVPMDVLRQTAKTSHHAPERPPEAQLPDPRQTEAAARILGAAKKPLIFAGGGAIETGEKLSALAEALQAPIVFSRNGLGIIDSRHPLVVPPPLGHRLWKTADVVFGIGTRLAPMLPHWGLDDELQIIRLDIDPEEIGRIAPPAVSMECDAMCGLTALLDLLPGHNRHRADRTEELTAMKAEIQVEFDKLEPQMSIVRALRRGLPDDGIFVEDLTQVGYVARFTLPVYFPRTYLNPGYQGTLGYAVPTALGAKVGHPDKKVLAISGDGGFMFNVQELATAVQHGIDIVVVVFNDGAYGNVKRFQHMYFEGKEIAVNLENPDFMKLADSFGLEGRRVDNPDELERAITRGFETAGSTLIEYPIGEVPDPWHLIQMRRARG